MNLSVDNLQGDTFADHLVNVEADFEIVEGDVAVYSELDFPMAELAREFEFVQHPSDDLTRLGIDSDFVLGHAPDAAMARGRSQGSPTNQEAMFSPDSETVHVTLMAEYECHPPWLDAPSEIDNVPVASLDISDELTMAINEWASSYEATYCPNDPLASEFADGESERAFVEVGYRPAHELQVELGDKFCVTYFDHSTSMKVPVVQ